MPESMLRVENLSFAYGTRRVLDGASFSVDKGKVCGLFGPNGSGKTTLFRCCLGFLRPQGAIHVDGRPTHSLRAGQLAKLVAYVPQEHRPPFPYSVFDVVLMGRTPHMGSGMFGVSKKDRSKALDAIDRLGISDLASSSYLQLSGGQRQLVLIARAMAQETPLILLDEPTSALDFNNQIRVWKLLTEIAAAGTTVLACAHDPNHVSWFCDRVVMLHEGRILASGPTVEVFDGQRLNVLYDGACEVVAVGDQRMVVPRLVANQMPQPHLASYPTRSIIGVDLEGNP